MSRRSKSPNKLVARNVSFSKTWAPQTAKPKSTSYFAVTVGKSPKKSPSKRYVTTHISTPYDAKDKLARNPISVQSSKRIKKLNPEQSAKIIHLTEMSMFGSIEENLQTGDIVVDMQSTKLYVMNTKGKLQWVPEALTGGYYLPQSVTRYLSNKGVNLSFHYARIIKHDTYTLYTVSWKSLLLRGRLLVKRIQQTMTGDYTLVKKKELGELSYKVARK